MQETNVQPGEWTLLRIGHKRRDVSTKAHRVDLGGRTICGFLIDGRAVPATGKEKRCLICAVSES